MCTRSSSKFNGASGGFLVVVMVMVLVKNASPSLETEWGSSADNNLQDPFADAFDPFRKALNSLSAWMELRNETHIKNDIPIGEVNDTLLRYYLPSPNTVNITEKCSRDVQAFLNAQKSDVKAALLAEDKLWPILIPDSWGKVPDGMFSGNFAPLGMMEECTAIYVKEDNILHKTEFNGKYCFVVYGKNGPPALQEMDGYSFRSPIQEQMSQMKAAPGAISILGHIPSPIWGGGSSYGTCMPDSCSADDFKTSLNEVLTGGNEAFWVHCHTKNEEGPPWEAKDYAFVSVMGCIGFLVILGAAVDLTINYLGKQELRKGPARYLLAFSGYSNMSKIFHINTKENPSNIACLHGMRVLSMTWVVWGHQHVFTLTAVENFYDIVYMFEDVIGQTLMNAQVSVDSFFFLSGLLVGYGLMRSKDKMDLYNFFMFYIHRFLRLAPPIAAVAFFGATVARFFATGPIGEATYLINFEHCNRNWWYDVLFINNYSLKYCVGQTWYTSVDMQIYVLVPLLFFPFMYYRKIGAAWLMFVTLLSCIIPLGIAQKLQIPPGIVGVPVDKSWDNTFLLYEGVWSRMTPYIVGLWTSYIIYRSNKKPLKMEWWQVTLGWFTASIVALLVLYGIYPFNHYNKSFGLDRFPEQVLSDIYIGFFRGAWGLALMWVVIACHTGYGGPVNSFLGHPSWQPLSRLTYGIYLIHIIVILLIESTSYRLKAIGHLQVIVETCGTLFISGIAATVLSLLVDSPILGLEKLLLKRDGGEPRPTTIKESQNKI